MLVFCVKSVRVPNLSTVVDYADFALVSVNLEHLNYLSLNVKVIILSVRTHSSSLGHVA